MANVAYAGIAFDKNHTDTITDVSPNSPASRAKSLVGGAFPVVKGDVVYSYIDAHGHTTLYKNKDNLNAWFQAQKPGDKITLNVNQDMFNPDGLSKVFTLGTAPAAPVNTPTPGEGYAGISVSPGADCQIVTHVDENSPAWVAGFKIGMTITSFTDSSGNVISVDGNTPLNQAIQANWPGDDVLFAVDDSLVLTTNYPGYVSNGRYNISVVLGEFPASLGGTGPPSSIDFSAATALAAEFSVFGDFFKPAFGSTFKTTAEYMADYMNTVSRDNSPPVSPNDWEMSIGACKFSVPPVNIQVSRSFQTGSMAGGAIRQIVPPKFNSGHSETTSGIKLYCPNQETIWGFDGPSLDIDFTKDSDGIVDRYLSSLRGLITAFRYSPILPITNTYLNKTFNITAVCLKTMHISTESDAGTNMPFPFCITVSLELIAFDHSVYLPMVNQLQDAVDWGKYRIYMGRCAYIMEAAANRQFATSDLQGAYQGTGNVLSANPNELQGINDPNSANYDPTQSGNATVKFNITDNLKDSTNIQFYYPPTDPVGQVPDFLTINNFMPTPADTATNQGWWSVFTGSLGLNQGSYGSWSQVAKYFNDPNLASQYTIVKQWLLGNRSAYNQYGPDQQAAYVTYATRGLSGAALAQATIEAQQAFLANAANEYLTGNPTLQNLYNAQAYARGQALIDEWDVPMVQLSLDPRNIVVTSVGVTTVNNFARLPLAMRDAPAYQHIGGLGSTIEVTLYAKGEKDLTSLRLMFDTISNLARLEHSHAVLGFLGLKNVIVALAGTKYVIPSSFDVETMNGMPHTYSVRMTFADFDVFQQKRETLSSEQQASLIKKFGKANPFLRLKQSWGMFNAYPDFPLSVKANETTTTGDVTVNSGDTVAHLDPDYYFNSYATLDDDLATLPNNSKNTAGNTTSTSDGYAVVHHIGTFSDNGDHFSIGLNDGYWDLRTNDQVHAAGITHNEIHPGNHQTNPFVPGLAPASLQQTPNFHTKGDGSQSTTGLIEANFKLMMKDQQYRDQNGRMVRAFPTYMLWLINEGGLFAGQQLFDNFYGLQSVIDFSFVDNEDVMGTTLILRVSNLYSRLSTTYSQQIDSNFLPQAATLINPTTNLARNLQSGTTNTTVLLDTITVQPGVRLHMRSGYGSNPNLLQTIFNGTVTSVEVGDIMTITAQSDAIELGAVVDNTNTSGTSTDIFSSAEAGLWFSEPRDLMVRLLSMGASTMKESIAQATAGMIFSENRFGIRHFGRVLYDSMTPNESAYQQAKETATTGKYNHSSATQFAQQIASTMTNVSSNNPSDLYNPLAAVGNLVDLLNQMYSNFSAAKDLEIFKRNIYPGNGTGIGQYTGGDLGDGGTATAFSPVGLSADGSINAIDYLGNAVNNSGNSAPGVTNASSAVAIIEQVHQSQFLTPADSSAGANKNGGIVSSLINDVGSVLTFGASNSGWMQQLLSTTAVTNPNGNLDEGAGPGMGGGLLGQYSGPFAEVSFRAHTYMKTVWDMFLTCAALLPNYIVAVRPFEDRSTIFYGKPHWAYTSGVIPVSTGRTHPTPGQPDTANSQNTVGSDGKKTTTYPGKLIGPNAFYSGSSQDTASLQQKIQDAFANLNVGQGAGTGSGESVYQKLTDLSVKEWTDVIGPTQATLAADPNTTASASTQNPGTGPAWVTPTVIVPNTNLSTLNTDINALPQFMAATRQHESSNDYTRDSGNGAYGAYQFISKTWTDICNKYNFSQYASGHASDYPAAIQDEVASAYMTDVFNDKKQWDYVAQTWYYPAWAGVAAHQNDIPAEYDSAGKKQNSLTMKEYGDAILQAMGDPTLAGSTVLANANAAQTNSNLLVPPWLVGNFDRTADNFETQSATRGATTTGIEVDFTSAYETAGKSITDVLGEGAKQLYSTVRSDNQANDIWDEFRTNFGAGPAKDQTKDESGTDPKTYFQNNFKKDLKDKTDSTFAEILINFREFMWTNAYHRGWIVLTADALTYTNVVAKAAEGLWGAIEPLILGDTAGAGAQKTALAWTFPRAFDLFKIYVGGSPDSATQDAGSGTAAAITWMQANSQAGYSMTNPFSRIGEEISRSTPFTDAAAAISAVAGVASSVVDTLRLTLTMLSGGMNLAFYSGGQANLLNSLFNDSIYYDAQLPGGPGGLPFLCDNAFTREYGEPVVEIREPFQRVHYLNSFQHIIANGITENSDQVATTVTCTTDGQHPITANFDKGAPAERQVEITVDDGLMYQGPQGIASIWHPLKALASFATHFNNGDNATNANRVARWHLKENLKNIYTGELIILGNAQIRTYDLIYLYDSYEKMYGLFEVEQVVHQFNPEMGFITSITPNAIVMINDPSKWQMGSMLHRQAAAQAIRNSIRTTLSSGQQGQNLVKNPDSTTLTNYANGMANDLLGTVQFTGGVGALIKDVGSVAGTDGALVGHPQVYGASSSGGSGIGTAVDAVAGTLTAGGSQLAGAAAGTDFTGLATTVLKWPAFSWLRDNLLDAHACYIQYLNRNGVPMDAGLSYNFGTAVGQANVISLFGDVLKIPMSEGGQTTITSQELLSGLGWNSKQLGDTANAMSNFENYTYNNVLALNGTSVPNANYAPPVPPTVKTVNISSIIEGTTFLVNETIEGTSQLTLAYILPPNRSGQALLNNPGLDLDVKAMNYIQSVASQIWEVYGDASVAIRYDTAHPHPTNENGTTLVTVFFRLPEDGATINNGPTNAADRIAKLMEIANNYGGVAWNDYMGNGYAYTLNQEMIDQGLASINPQAFGGSNAH